MLVDFPKGKNVCVQALKRRQKSNIVSSVGFGSRSRNLFFECYPVNMNTSEKEEDSQFKFI